MNQGICINNSCEYDSENRRRVSTLAGRRWEALLATVRLWRQRAQTRRYLREMPAYLLKDVGIDESQRQREVDKPFWR